MEGTFPMKQLTLLLMLAASMFAGTDFSGEWKLDPAKSDFGPMPAPDKLVMKVAHKDPDLKVTMEQASQQGEVKMDSVYTTDGKVSKNKMRGSEATTTAKWEGDALMMVTKADFQGNEIKLNDKWTLTDGGKTLVIDRKIEAPQGEFEVKQVLTKQ